MNIMAKGAISKIILAPLLKYNTWWAHLDSNQGPKDYESSALTN